MSLREETIVVNEDAMRKIEELNRLYEKNWGREVDYTIVPRGMTQEMLVMILGRIVDTGESVLVGYDKIYKK